MYLNLILKKKKLFVNKVNDVQGNRNYAHKNTISPIDKQSNLASKTEPESNQEGSIVVISEVDNQCQTTSKQDGSIIEMRKVDNQCQTTLNQEGSIVVLSKVDNQCQTTSDHGPIIVISEADNQCQTPSKQDCSIIVISEVYNQCQTTSDLANQIPNNFKLTQEENKILEEQVEKISTPDSNSAENFLEKSENREKENISISHNIANIGQNLPANVYIQSIIINSEDHVMHLIDSQREDEKVMSQLSAAERSVKTNLVLGTIFIIVMSCSIFVADKWRNHFYAIVVMSIRGSMPILTAIANFGTVKNVASQYFNQFKHRLTTIQL
jgi:hypothetical protein